LYQSVEGNLPALGMFLIGSWQKSEDEQLGQQFKVATEAIHPGCDLYAEARLLLRRSALSRLLLEVSLLESA
jgi:hypothetical protein